jgi:predicted transcriptional regulator
MNIDEYLNLPVILDFIRWIDQRLDRTNSFNHSYIDAKTHKKWCCNSIYDAYKQYKWEKKNFNETQEELSEYKNKLEVALSNNNVEEVKKVCISVLEWGVKNGNKTTIENCDDIVHYLLKTREEIAPYNFDTNQNVYIVIYLFMSFLS